MVSTSCLLWVLSWRKRASSGSSSMRDVVGGGLALGLERSEFALQGFDLFLQRGLAPDERLDMLGFDGLVQGHGGEVGQAPGELAGGGADLPVEVAVVGVDDL